MTSNLSSRAVGLFRPGEGEEELGERLAMLSSSLSELEESEG